MFIRDGRAPIPIKVSTSNIMSANKGKDTKPEILIRKALWTKDVKGYRLHWKHVPGRPDISFPKRKLAVFINGCFWHRCPYCKLKEPKSNSEFWSNKFKNTKERDIRKTKELRKSGWTVITIWECQIKNKIEDCVTKIRSVIKKIDTTN